MDKSSTKNLDSALPIWTCQLEASQKVYHVGDVRTLSCTGFDFVPVGGAYELELWNQTENLLKILSVKKDEKSAKEFEVVSYVVAKGEQSFKLKRDGKAIFQSSVKDFKLKSVIENPAGAKMIPPLAGYYAVPSSLEILSFCAALFSVLLILTLRGVKKAKAMRDFRRVVSKSRYADPFMDFNVEMRDYSMERKGSVLFLDLLEDSFKKIFYRIFGEPVSLATLPQLIRQLKGLGLESHEVRSFYVLEEEYKKFKLLYQKERGQVFEQKKEFLAQAKKTVNKLKAYVAVEG